MSPQNSSLGLIGSVGSSSIINRSRYPYTSGMYRPEDNAYFRQYVTENIRNFQYTGYRLLTGIGTNDPSTPTCVRIGDTSRRLFFTGSRPNITSRYLTNENTLSEGWSTSSISKSLNWYEYTTSFNWIPSPTGISFKPDGSSVILSGRLNINVARFFGSCIYQYSLSTPWNISTIQGFPGLLSTTKPQKFYLFRGDNIYTFTSAQDILNFYNTGVTSDPTTNRIDDIYVHPDGNIFYYLIDNILYQGNISTSWDIGLTGQNLSFNVASINVYSTLESVVGTFFAIDRIVGIDFNSTGTKLYLTSRGFGGFVFQYNLSIPWQISSYTFVSFIYVGSFLTGTNVPGGSSFSDEGVQTCFINDYTMLFLRNFAANGQLYEFKVPVF
jgi:hypothetical protein